MLWRHGEDKYSLAAYFTEDMTEPAHVYLLRCADGTLYCGWTTDVERRVREHESGAASYYTRSRRPVALAWSKPMPSRGDALREEYRIKRLSRAEKLQICD